MLDESEVVVGTVHVKDAVALPLHERATTRVKHLMAKPTVVPDSLRLDPLMALLRADGFQMAIVLDEYGDHAGIVTLEDVIEEIVGDIADEHDRMGNRGRLRRDGTWSLSGLLRPDEVQDATTLALPENEDYDTVAGLLVKKVGGPSVKPYQPAGYWSALNFPTREWQKDTGEKVYRRGMYIVFRRATPYPMLLAFDAPDSTIACVRRERSCPSTRPRSRTTLT